MQCWFFFFFLRRLKNKLLCVAYNHLLVPVEKKIPLKTSVVNVCLCHSRPSVNIHENIKT